ncbi:ArpU family phage packaging/lysis transcriptional regulator [Rossellomorea sp. DUT-2]|uniref:ArpU family phage packaging/lysis transcriptional regulator n=1 Tax=Rossellomorea sp. DUT-2 TaxID=3412021 RepID=UPI003D16D442
MVHEKEAKERRKLTVKKLKQLRPLITWYKNKEVAESHGVKQSLFNEGQNANKRKSKELTYHQFRAIMDDLQEGERKIIEMKYLDVQSKSDLFIMEELHLKKDIYYSTKNDALEALAVNFDLD